MTLQDEVNSMYWAQRPKGTWTYDGTGAGDTIQSKVNHYYWAQKQYYDYWNANDNQFVIDMASLGATRLWLAEDYAANADGEDAEWTDRIGSVTLSQSTHAIKPIEGTLNGYSTLQFDDSNPRKVIYNPNESAYDWYEPNQIAVLYYPIDSSYYGTILAQGTNNWDSNVSYGDLEASIWAWRWNGVSIGTAGLTADTWQVAAFSHVLGEDASYGRFADEAQITRTTTPDGSAPDHGLSVGGRVDSTSVRWAGHVLAVVANTNGTWNKAQFNNVIQQLMAYYANLSSILWTDFT